MSVLEIARIQVRRGQENQTGVPQLEPGEFGWAQDTEHLYIGKRIAEGAVDNNNTRILTENDIDNIFALLNSTVTQTTVYQYRESVAHIASENTPILLQDRLDETVSLLSFGVVASFIPADITVEFQNAVKTIFQNQEWDSVETKDSRRRLTVPAGHYYISEPIELPPYTTLVGEGSDLTTLTLTINNNNLFKTIDAEGNAFETEDMRSGVLRARGVRIRGMTLEYSPTTASDNALISFDNVLDAVVEDCVFRTAINSTSTTTYGLVSYGVGVEIRGTGGGLGTGDVNLCENITVKDCRFDSLNIGVRSTGTVIKTTIGDNIFSNLNKGVEFYSVNSLPGPNNGLITNNRFENIVQQGVVIGPNPLSYRTENIISYNSFIQVGNGIDLTDFATTSTNKTPVITVGSPGNKLIDNYFHRKQIASSTTSTTFYYNPIITGSATIIDNSMFTATIVSSSTSYVTKIPLTGQDQMISLRYQLTNNELSRKGNLIVNVAPDGYSAITDTFNYIETIEEGTDSPLIYFGIDQAYINSNNYVLISCINASSSSIIEYQEDTTH